MPEQRRRGPSRRPNAGDGRNRAMAHHLSRGRARSNGEAGPHPTVVVARAVTTGIFAGGEWRRWWRSGHRRDHATKHQTARDNLRSNRGSVPRRPVVVRDQKVAGNRTDDELWRPRVWDLDGGYARRHGEARARARWAPGSSRSSATSSDARSGHGGHDGEVICGGELKATATS